MTNLLLLSPSRKRGWTEEVTAEDDIHAQSQSFL